MDSCCDEFSYLLLHCGGNSVLCGVSQRNRGSLNVQGLYFLSQVSEPRQLGQVVVFHLSLQGPTTGPSQLHCQRHGPGSQGALCHSVSR